MSQDSPTEVLRKAGIQFKKRGNEARFPCPHCGKDEGFDFNLSTGAWRCKRASCGMKGSLYELQVLCGLAIGVDSSSIESPAQRLRKAFEVRPESKHERWHRWLMTHEKAAPAREYLLGRGIPETVWVVAQLGWCPRHPSDKKRKGKIVGAGVITIPYFVPNDRTKPVMVKLRWVPPEPIVDGRKMRYARIAGGESILYTPAGLHTQKEVIICGGEMDALSVLAALHKSGFPATKFEDLPFTVVSVPDGESWSDLLTEQLIEFENIIVGFDNDRAGRRGAKTVSKKLGDWRCRLGTWPGPGKDANDALMSGDLDLFSLQAMSRTAKSMAGQGILKFSSLKDRIIHRLFHQSREGMSTGIKDIDEILGGWRPGETTVLSGGTGSGKTTIAVQFAESMRERGVPTLYCPFEGGPVAFGIKLLRTQMGHDPGEMSVDEVCDAIDAVENLVVLEHEEAINPDVWKATLNYCINRLGIKFVVVDHLDFMYPRDAQDEYKIKSQHIINTVSIINDTDAHCILISHPNKGGKGTGADRDDVVIQMSDLKGHATAYQDVWNVCGMYRPRSATREQEMIAGLYPSVFIVLKCRDERGNEGSCDLGLDKEAGRFSSLNGAEMFSANDSPI